MSTRKKYESFLSDLFAIIYKITGACNYNINPEKTKKPKMFWCSKGCKMGTLHREGLRSWNAFKMSSKHFLKNFKTLWKKSEPTFWSRNKSVTRVKIKTLSPKVTAKRYTWFLPGAYLQAARNNVLICHGTLYASRMNIRGIAFLVVPAKESKNLWPFDA